MKEKSLNLKKQNKTKQKQTELKFDFEGQVIFNAIYWLLSCGKKMLAKTKLF